MSVHIRYATLYVSDQKRSLDFYTTVLGFEKRRDEPMGPDQRWIEVAPPGSDTTVLLYKPSEAMPGAANLAEARARMGGFSGIGLHADDIEALFTTLRAHGARIIEEPAEQPWGWQGIFADPDGNQFVVV